MHDTGRKRARPTGARRLLLLAMAATCLVTAGGASAQTTTTTTTITPGPPGSVEGQGLTGTATLLPNGTALAPPTAPLAVQNAIRAANRIHTRTYIWGGGHRRWKSKGYDCSGAVSYVLHAAGLLSAPLVSGQLAKSWGSPGLGSWITVYANRSHTFMVIAGLRYDTSPVGESWNQGRGPRWRANFRSVTGFAVRYYPGF
jgi:hypothetical protein